MHRHILDNLNTAVLLFNRDLTLLYINTAGEMLLADSSKHLIGLHAYSIFRFADANIIDNLQQCADSEEPLIARALTLHQLNKTLHVNLNATPLFDQNEFNEILVELQLVENALRSSREEQYLTQKDTARLLIRGLAHEIKNPLGGLRGAAQLLDLELSEDLKEYTRIIMAESDRLQSLLDKMLAPNKLPNKKLLNIHEVFERVRLIVQAENSQDLTLITNYDPSIPELFGDKDQLIQAFLNIGRNAVQATNGKGRIEFKTRVCRHLTIEGKHYKLGVKCDVIDDGVGIAPNMLNKIFYPMITSRAEGTGLGLSIAQTLITQHHGLIECSSEPRHTVFSIFLPIEKPL